MIDPSKFDITKFVDDATADGKLWKDDEGKVCCPVCKKSVALALNEDRTERYFACFGCKLELLIG